MQTASTHRSSVVTQKEKKMLFSNSWILPLKVFFISTGVLSTGLFFKTSVPFFMNFSVSRAPTVWSSFLSWLKPPYLYLIINGIIVTIVFSSRFYPSNDVSTESSSSSSLSRPPPNVEYEMKVKSDFGGVVYEQQRRDVDIDYEMKVKSDFDSVVEEQEQTQEVEEIKAPVFQESIVVSDGAKEVGYEDATWTRPKRTDPSEILTEYGLLEAKPLVSARFGHRKPIKAGRLSPAGGKALRVTKPKQHETLESTWKTITEGRAMPWTRHLKKSDTQENHGRHIDVDPSPVKKSETFEDRSNNQLPPVNNSPARTGKLRKEPSLSQDELNRRVEAFIKKFNDEMRLQRQESLRQYQEMIGRGV